MKTSEGVALTAVAVILYGLISKSQAANTLIILPDKFLDLKRDGFAIDLVTGFRVQNTSNQSFTLNSLAANLYADNYLVANISYFTPTTIKPNTEGILAVNARLKAIGIVNDIINAWNTGDFAQDVEIIGYANVDKLQIPLKFIYKIG